MYSRQHKTIAIHYVVFDENWIRLIITFQLLLEGKENGTAHYVVFDENWIRLMNMGRGFNKETHKHITIGMG